MPYLAGVERCPLFYFEKRVQYFAKYVEIFWTSVCGK